MNLLPPHPPPWEPTQAPPGSLLKLGVLKRRAALGLPLFHPGDALFPIRRDRPWTRRDDPEPDPEPLEENPFMTTPFDLDRAIGLNAARALVRGRGGERVSLDALRRWAKQGCRPAGPSGPVLILPTVKLNGEILTMPEWVAAFERERVALALAAALAAAAGGATA